MLGITYGAAIQAKNWGGGEQAGDEEQQKNLVIQKNQKNKGRNVQREYTIGKVRCWDTNEEITTLRRFLYKNSVCLVG